MGRPRRVALPITLPQSVVLLLHYGLRINSCLICALARNRTSIKRLETFRSVRWTTRAHLRLLWMLSRFFGFDKLNFFLYYVCILSGCCVTVARTVWDRLVWVRIPAARHEVALGFEPSKGGRGKVFSPCRKLFKTEGFERRPPRVDGGPRVPFSPPPPKKFFS